MEQPTQRPVQRLVVLLGALASVVSVDVSAGCVAQSGRNTSALVELYTSEGCSSCPPADQYLSRLKQQVDPQADVVALSLHVDYWDDIGWKDSFAQHRFDDRQSALARAYGRGGVYTPQFFVGGAELRSWRAGLAEHVRQANAVPAAADIRIRASLAANASLVLDVAAHAGDPSAALYVAITESGLSSAVTRGENRGATLTHDHVVRALFGPVSLAGGEASVLREFPLPLTWNRRNLAVAAFVSDERTGAVLQALEAKQCTS